ncbi:hypothetical protein GCM10027601_21340 [Nocardioides ungokensis]
MDAVDGGLGSVAAQHDRRVPDGYTCGNEHEPAQKVGCGPGQQDQDEESEGDVAYSLDGQPGVEAAVLGGRVGDAEAGRRMGRQKAYVPMRTMLTPISPASAVAVLVSMLVLPFDRKVGQGR